MLNDVDIVSFKHVNAEAMEKADVCRPEFDWETNNRPKDCSYLLCAP